MIKHYLPLAGLLLASGCNSLVPTTQPGTPIDNAPVTGRPVNTPAKGKALVATASSDKSKYKRGETANLSITVKNTSGETQTLNYSSGQSFDFQAFKEGEKDTAWTWSMDKMFTQALRSAKLKPGESATFTGEWLNVPSGKYQIRGWITANGSIQAEPFAIVVE